jgi:hypothetical protein
MHDLSHSLTPYTRAGQRCVPVLELVSLIALSIANNHAAIAKLTMAKHAWSRHDSVELGQCNCKTKTRSRPIACACTHQ